MIIATDPETVACLLSRGRDDKQIGTRRSVYRIYEAEGTQAGPCSQNTDSSAKVAIGPWGGGGEGRGYFSVKLWNVQEL